MERFLLCLYHFFLICKIEAKGLVISALQMIAVFFEVSGHEDTPFLFNIEKL